MSVDPRVLLKPIRVLHVETLNLKGRMGEAMEFLSFDGNLLYQVAQNLILRESTSPLSSLRLVYVRDERSDEREVWYDANLLSGKELIPYIESTNFSSRTSGVEVVNDELRKGYGFSTHDIPVPVEELHSLRLCIPKMPRAHSAWVRSERRYLLFQNGVLARRC